MVTGPVSLLVYSILLPIDDDEARVEAQTNVALELLAARDDIGITVLHVFGENDDSDERATFALPTGQSVEAKLSAAGASVQERTRVGDPAEEILDVAHDIGANQIILGGRKRSAIGAMVFGSVSQAVIREATRPVTITGSIEQLERPSHRCVDCGEAYYTTPETSISTCRQCGGVHVESLREQPEA